MVDFSANLAYDSFTPQSNSDGIQQRGPEMPSPQEIGRARRWAILSRPLFLGFGHLENRRGK